MRDLFGHAMPLFAAKKRDVINFIRVMRFDRMDGYLLEML
jgi:hypothetical protein